MKTLNCDFLRDEIVGVDSFFDTPYGQRMMVYCDYTASGRCLNFVENYILELQKIYANTHTEDDVTGRSMTKILHQAESIIKSSVNAGDHGRLIAVGTGSTGAIDKLQQILGVAMSPVSWQMLMGFVAQGMEESDLDRCKELIKKNRPVVFVGPYEHHSNEVTWRQGLAEVVEIKLTDSGEIDLLNLEELIQQPQYQNRMKIGSFSAASNVTGMVSPVHEIAAILHRYDAIACFDYAASAPYVEIDMNPPLGQNGEDYSLDAIFISPHKFLGGPGTCGILVFRDQLYHSELPPTVGGGGTVDYVGVSNHDFITDIEEREKAGTPGVLQMMKAALAFEVKNRVGIKTIEHREQELLERVFTAWESNSGIEILGNPDPKKRIGIVSFNIKDPRENYLHPKFVTVLLNDLFGIQSRAGCSCAGPYGHRLLNIDNDTSERFRSWITKGYQGIKPGWCRVGFHYSMDDIQADYVIQAIDFIAQRGYLFMDDYHFDIHTGAWIHKQEEGKVEDFSLDAALEEHKNPHYSLSREVRNRVYSSYMLEAQTYADKLEKSTNQTLVKLEGELSELQFFTVSNGSA